MSFKATPIPFSITGQFAALFTDYVNGKPELSSFFAFSPDDNGYRQSAEQLRFDEKNRAVLVSAIRSQYACTEIEPDKELIGALEREGTMTVCTGHQLCLFTGPLYFIYKLITTVRVAEEQSKKLGRPVVPVYWLASEDHDFEEVRSVNLFGKTLHWETEAKGAVGRLQTVSLGKMLEELKTVMGENEAANKLFAKIQHAYYPGKRSLTEATREFVHELSGGKILILDADDAKLKKIFIPVMKNDVTEHAAEKFIGETIASLEKNGYGAQVNPRTINLFYMKDEVRERMEEKDGKYVVLNTDLSFTREALLDEMEKHPEHFSPNVVLRPVYQQLILPNIAYVGGPGELAYWLEYKAMFDHFNVHFPLLQPRHFALILDKNSEERLAKLNLPVEELFADVEETVKSFVRKTTGEALSMEPEKAKLKKLFEGLREKIVPIDPTLKGAVEAELQKQLNALENLEGKVMRAAKQKQETSVNQLRKLREKLLPAGMLQERYENFIPFYLKYGEDFITQLSQQFDLPVNSVLLLTEN